MNKPGIFPPEAAALYRSLAGQKYQPSNGMEGEIFMQRWCCQCARFDPDDGCGIQSDTMLYALEDPNYPKEWRYTETGQPECTDFWEGDDMPVKDDLTMDMFG